MTHCYAAAVTELLLKCTIDKLTNIPCLVYINVQKTSVNVNRFFSAWKNSVIHLHSCTSMSNAFLSNCSSAATCHKTIKCNGILVKMFSLYFHTTNIHAWFVSQHYIIGGVNFIALIVIFSTYSSKWKWRRLYLRSTWNIHSSCL